MSSDVSKGAATALTIRDNQTTFTPEQGVALQHLGVTGASRADVDIFFHQCKRTGLDPFAKQIYMIERQGKQTIQTGIDGFRLIAVRAVRASKEAFGYEDNLWCGEDGVWREVWTGSTPPVAAKVTVLRNGQRFPAVALYEEYAGRKRNGEVMAMWKSRPAGQLAKCAEALALRKAFPQDLSGLYTADEMEQADVTEPAPPATSVREPQTHAAPQDPEPELGPDAVDQRMQDTWDNVDGLRKLHTWLRSSKPQDPRLATIAQRGQELAEQSENTVIEAEIVDESEHAETLPINQETNA